MHPNEYEVPYAIEQVFKNILWHMMKSDSRLAKIRSSIRSSRCKDIIRHSKGEFLSGLSTHVNIGFYNNIGFIISDNPDDGTAFDLSITASRKLPPV